MIITRMSGFTGRTHRMNLPIAVEQLVNWRNGELIQHAMPNLTASQREFVMTGVTEQEWNETFGTGNNGCQGDNSG